MVYTDNNTISIIGRITKDASLKTIKDDFGEISVTVCNNTLTKKDGNWAEKPNFFIVKQKGTKLDKFASVLTKGKQVSVQGILQQDSWESNGQKASMVYILATKIQPLTSGKSENSNTQAAQSSDVSPENFPEDYPEDIPF